MSSTIRSNRSTIRSTMSSKEYWARRAEERADKHHEELETYLKRIDSIVNGACGRLKKDAETILNKCVARMGMSREETIKLMQEPVDYESLQRMLKTIEHMPEGAEKRKIQNQVEAKAYGYRVSRIEALEIDIKAESVRLAQRLTEATSDSLKHTAINAIKWTEKDLKEMLGGASISFQKVDPTLIDELIHNSWSGKDFSERIWKNCEILEKNLNTTLKEGLLSGKGTYRIAEELADDMDCGKYAAQRLVRTETTHVYNEVDRKKYNEAGIEEYEYLACLDERTSEICKRLNGKRFKVDDAKPGVNYPPMHPNCRSTTVAVLDNVWGKEDNKKRNVNLHKDINPNRKYYSRVSKEDFEKLTKKFRDRGGLIIQDDEIEKFLDYFNADAACSDSTTIKLRKDPAYTELLEELFHSDQFVENPILDVTDRIEIYRREVEAKKWVLSQIDKYHVPEIEKKDLIRNIEQYEKLLKEEIG